MREKLQNKFLTIIFAAAFFVAPCLPAKAAEPAKKAPKEIPTVRPNLNVMKIAHRGSVKYAPENTIPAIEKAIKLGMDYVELDVRFTKDNVAVAMHDGSIVRTTGRFMTMNRLTFEKIREFDAGGWFSKEFKGTKVPSMEEAFQVMRGKIKFYCDQKEAPTKEFIELMRKYDFYPGNVVLVGGNLRSKEFRELDPEAPVMPGVGSVEDIEKILEEIPNPTAFNTLFSTITEEMIDLAHKNGVMIFCNTLVGGEKPEVMRRLIEMGVDAIQTDEPLMLREVIEEMKKERGAEAESGQD